MKAGAVSVVDELMALPSILMNSEAPFCFELIIGNITSECNWKGKVRMNKSWKRTIAVILLIVLLDGCVSVQPKPIPSPSATSRPGDPTLSEDEIATLNSLEQLDTYPLYTLRYVGAYPDPAHASTRLGLAEIADQTTPNECQDAWGCSLFAALSDPSNRLYGRNFDWRFSPTMLLFTDPPDGYASVSMVDIDYLGFGGSRAKDLINLPPGERKALLQAPALPFDGMNEKGLAIGMAAVPPGEMSPDPNKITIGELAVIRVILDHASTIDEAVDILASHNIDMGNVPVHYLIASAAGNSALVEFYRGKMVVFRNENAWQLATNFLVASTDGRVSGQCPRFDRISQQLQEKKGQLTVQEALDLLAGVSQSVSQGGSDTQWSIVYEMTSGDVHVVMGRKYTEGAHTLHLSLSDQ